MLFDSWQVKNRNSAKSTQNMRPWPRAIILLGLLGLLCSCSTASNYGNLQSSYDITLLFEKAQVLSDHTYYYSGLHGVPDAIIAIQRNYMLRAKLWQQIDFSQFILQKWTTRMNYVHQIKPQGAWIMGPDGDRLGIWYSAQRQTSVRLNRKTRLIVAPPHPPELRGIP